MMNRILLAAAAAACLPFAAQAHDEAAHAGEANKMIVVRDADTGALRAATAEEAAALAAKPAAGKTPLAGARGVVAQQPLLKSHRSGAQGARITDEMASYSVAVRRADGTIDTQCVEGKTEAETVLSTTQTTALPTAQTARTDK